MIDFVVSVVSSEANVGFQAVIAKVMHAAWQRRRVRFMLNGQTHSSKSGRRMVSAFISTAFAQKDAKSAKAEWPSMSDRQRLRVRAAPLA